ncbi:MAG: site-specific integrase [Gemmatimonadaceae bacterium]|nr:site-specific integrase [Gemmatimonadaceae bacterium]NUR35287.1 site-specific integrase [Gemmatimonadaceae bacterium]HWI89032.1 site-specific integrase [Sphingomicrobium sp.]
MAPRGSWHQIKGRWTRTLGEHGLRVRLFQMRKGGTFYRDVWLPEVGKDRKYLQTTDRAEAERLGRAFLAARLREEHEAPLSRVLTLGTLWDRFRRESQNFLDNSPHSRQDAAVRAATLIAYFGKDCDVRMLSGDDQAAYTIARRAGGIQVSPEYVTAPVRLRTAESDLVVLHQMLNWASTVRVKGVRLLDGNPLAGIRRAREQNPRRPIASHERFVATRAAMQMLHDEEETDPARARWLKMELALVLAEATGRRLGAIRQLRWEDIDWAACTIHWRAEADKKRREAVIPMPLPLANELRRFQRRLGTMSGWIFASQHSADRPMDRHLFDNWLRRAEKAAGLKKLVGGLWHPYRRAWATARKHLPITDVAAAGGWKDTETLLTCYQQADTQTLLAVMAEERKVHESHIATAANG